jgi:hypothetical protein
MAVFLQTGGCYSEVFVSSGLTVWPYQKAKHLCKLVDSFQIK